MEGESHLEVPGDEVKLLVWAQLICHDGLVEAVRVVKTQLGNDVTCQLHSKSITRILRRQVQVNV